MGSSTYRIIIAFGFIGAATSPFMSNTGAAAMMLPIVLVMFVALLVVILFLNRPEVERVEGVEEYIADEKRRLGPLSTGERNTLIAFGVALTLWTLPGLVGLFLGDDSSCTRASATAGWTRAWWR